MQGPHRRNELDRAALSSVIPKFGPYLADGSNKFHRRSCSSRRYDGTIMMARTQITLSAEEHRRAKAKAAELGISLAEYFRRLVAQDLSPTPPKKGFTFIGMGDSKGSDVGRQKHEYIGEAAWNEHVRSVDGDSADT